MPFAIGDSDHTAEHNLLRPQVNAALNELAGRLSEESLNAAIAESRGLLPGGSQATSRAIALTDLGNAIEVSASSDLVLTVPLHTTTTFPDGAEIEVVTKSTGRALIRPTGANFYPNPNAEVDALGWGPRNSATISQVAGAGVSGSAAIRSTANGGVSTSYGHFGDVYSLASLGLKPGQYISMCAWLNPISSGGSTSAAFTIRFMIGATVTHSETAQFTGTGAGYRFGTNVQIPFGCDGLRLVTYYNPGVTGSALDVDNIMGIVGDSAPGAVSTYADGSSTGWFWTGTSNKSASMGPLLFGDLTVPAKSRARLRHIGGGTWVVAPSGVPDDVLRDSDTLVVDRDNGQQGMVAPGQPFTRSTVALVANRAYLCRIVPSRNLAVTRIAFRTTTASGTDDPCDVGLYSSAGVRLASSGATSGRLNSVGTKTVTIGTTTLLPGTVYYVAFAANSTASIEFAGVIGDLFGTAMPQAEAFIKATSYPLPSTISALTVADSVPLLAAREV